MCHSFFQRYTPYDKGKIHWSENSWKGDSVIFFFFTCLRTNIWILLSWIPFIALVPYPIQDKVSDACSFRPVLSRGTWWCRGLMMLKLPAEMVCILAVQARLHESEWAPFAWCLAPAHSTIWNHAILQVDKCVPLGWKKNLPALMCVESRSQRWTWLDARHRNSRQAEVRMAE